jgi:tRNA dimethylallyltransferase
MGDPDRTTRVDAVLIAGPTGSGKSELAARIAGETGGAIVNADSMQVYEDLRVLTARPDAAELARATHHLYGFVDGAEAYSAGRYGIDVARTLQKLKSTGVLPIIVGGTGLYFRVLLQGLSPIPAISADVRAHWRAEAIRLGAEKLHEVLQQRDAEMASRLVPTDPQRIVRALEVLEETGQSLAVWQRLPGVPIVSERRVVRLVVDLPREEIYERCDRRFDVMLENGGLEEVSALMGRELSPELPIMRAVGVPPLMALLRGELGKEAAVARSKQETRHYVKRQLTWLKRNMCAWKRFKMVHYVNYRALSEF